MTVACYVMKLKNSSSRGKKKSFLKVTYHTLTLSTSESRCWYRESLLIEYKITSSTLLRGLKRTSKVLILTWLVEPNSFPTRRSIKVMRIQNHRFTMSFLRTSSSRNSNLKEKYWIQALKFIETNITSWISYSCWSSVNWAMNTKNLSTFLKQRTCTIKIMKKLSFQAKRRMLFSASKSLLSWTSFQNKDSLTNLICSLGESNSISSLHSSI